MEIAFKKMQGVGNDFIVIDARDGIQADWTEVAVRMCRRHFGIGSDGLLVIGDEAGADARMDMFNPDGTRDFCGNGLRCVARYVADRLSLDGPTELRIATMAGTRWSRVTYGPSGATVTVDMGEPRFDPASIPMAVDAPDAVDYELPLSEGKLKVTALSTGTAHAVTFVDTLPDDATFLKVSDKVEMHPLFPERTSVMWVRKESDSRLAMRIWERGAGETLGCGTGACAAAVAARRKGMVGRTVTVVTRGGELTITWDEGQSVLMTGPAEYVFEGSFAW